MDDYENQLKKFDDNLIKPSAVTALVVIASTIIGISYYLGQTYTKNPLLVWGTIAGLLIFAATNFIPQLKFSKAHKTYLVLYHAAIIWVTLIILPIMSHFLMLWVVLTYVSEYYYKKIGLLLSLIVLALTMALGLVYQNMVSPIMIYEMGSMYFILVAASLVFSSIISGTLQNRGLLADKMIRAEYEHERVLSLINGMSDAVIATDENGVINIYNAAALELLNTNTGIDDQNINSVLRITDINHQPIKMIDYAKSLKNNISKAEFFLDISENDRRTLEVNISRTTLFSPIGQQKGYTFVMRDITEEKSLREERDDFVSVVSHELRTPIAVAEANTAMAQLQVKNPKHKPADVDKSLDNAHRQIIFLSEMINDLATLSKAETKKNKIEIEKFSADDVLHELDVNFRPKADAKGLGFNIKIEPALPEMATSRLYVKDILQNFISNAIKYTNEGSVEVTAKSTDNNSIVFAVKDTGTGITKAEQSKLFQKFWRSEDIHTRETEGTGLGLYIAAKLAKELGADIKVDSVKDKGSTFSVVVPTKVGVGGKIEVIEKQESK